MVSGGFLGFADDGSMGIGGGESNKLWDIIFCTVRKHYGTAETATEKAKERAGVRVVLHYPESMIKIGVASCQ